MYSLKSLDRAWRSSRSGRLIAGLLAMLTILLTVPVAPAQAADGEAAFSADPATKAGRDGRSRFTYELAPGQRVTDYVEIRNDGKTRGSFVIYTTDAYNTPEGAFALLTSAQVPQGPGTWADFGHRCDPAADRSCTIPSSAEVTLGPGKSKVVPFTIKVPADARPGDHAGGVVASLASGKGQIRVENRVITRMYIRVAGELQPHVSIGGIRTELGNGWASLSHPLKVTYTLTNTGNVALRGRIESWVTGPFGNRVATGEKAETSELLPGQKRTLVARMAGVPALGLLTAHVRLVPFVDAGALDPGPLTNTERTASLWVVPWLVVVALVIAVAAVVWAWRRRRSRAARHAAELETALAEGRRQALEETASSGEPPA
ncbi:hypothetical protein Pth03_53500 [Planotetraspora thailandica]|uniref:DUF916 domain-containing protein n=1 Tax=Planotetraspora thailandica TaxID=487172 RepID=A0A8J3XY95_9ACTN|nr:DUF916 domain-containing protein [Planotetraspora thailandica]GII56961.1 hypothetical protein Pth03_53500 [Planotetraspora thailandica]